MYSLERFIFGIAMTIATVWIVKRYWGSFFEKKEMNKSSIVILCLYSVLQMFFQTNRGTVSTFLLVINVTLILLIAISGYNCKGKRKFFLLFIFCAVWALLEFLVFFLVSNLHMKNQNENILGEVISKMLMILFVYILSTFDVRTKEEGIPNKFYGCLLFIPIGSIYIAINAFYGKTYGVACALVVSLLLMFNVIIYELYIKMNEVFIHERENALYAQQVDLIACNTAEQKRMMEDFHEEKHNLVNELIVLKDLIRTGNESDAVDNIDEIINGCYYTERISDTGNSTVDAIINFKYAVAREYGIEFCLKVFIPDEMPIEQRDIGVVLGNALDNAIEAVKNCKDHEKRIEITMGVKKEAWIMIIKNPYENEIKQDRSGKIVTNKSDKSRHGYGLKSIEKISDKYQGDVITDMEDGVFAITVVLNFGEI